MSSTINSLNIDKLNKDITQFSGIFPITDEMEMSFTGISRLIMLDRYAYKDTKAKTIAPGDLVVLTTKADSQYPTRGIGIIQSIDRKNNEMTIEVEEEYRGSLTGAKEAETGLVHRLITEVEKPLELYYEQIAKRVATGIAKEEIGDVNTSYQDFYQDLVQQNLIPAGRVLYGAGTDSQVTYFNCYVMPFIQDSREGLAEHRKEVMEIMSRGGGVGTNGSTLRPKSAVVRGVNGKSSGAVSWLNDLANLTHLVEQGGSRRGAQMIMMADWHPDIFEFILSKMQNPHVLHHLIQTTKSPLVKQLAQEKLEFTPITPDEKAYYEQIVALNRAGAIQNKNIVKQIEEKLRLGGVYSVKDSDLLTGANISVCITKDFMDAVAKDGDYQLRFPAVETYDDAEMAEYDENWSEIGDVREWAKQGHEVTTYYTIKARELWDLITYCATYSAEPGIFFIDNANDMTNATAYGQKVVATNPCGEQPLTPYAVCNLAAINLANMVDKKNHCVDYDKLAKVVRHSVHFQDNVIDATPYFFEKNRIQAKGERRVGLGVMGLADLLIYCEKAYGSKAGNELVDKVFETIAVTAYETSIELAKTKGSFPFLIGKNDAETQELRQRFINSGYMKQMPEHIRQGVLKYGIRNSHLLTVAPTGSTGTMAGVSTGLEPYFSFSYFRSGRLGKFIEVNAKIVDEYLESNPSASAQVLPEFFVSAMELDPQNHVDVQCTIQRWVDSSISKTVNAPRGYQVQQVAEIYENLYRGGAKGGTVYVDGSRDSQVLTLEAKENGIDQEPAELTQNSDSKEISKIKPEVKVELKMDVQPKTAHLASHEEHQHHTHDTVDVDSLIANGAKEGTDAGDICPVCHQGVVEDIGGCSTCTNCNVQLKCGL